MKCNLVAIILSLCCIATASSQLSITEMVRSPNNTNLTNELFEVELVISGADYANPYDEDDIDVEVMYTELATGETYEVDAFWYQQYDRCDDCDQMTAFTKNCKYDDKQADAEYMTPASTPRPWRARFAPPRAGEWSYRAAVRNQGTVGTSEEQTTIFSESENKGTIAVADDNRSFSYQDGTPYFPIGMNLLHYGKPDNHSRVLYNTTTSAMKNIADYDGNLVRLWMDAKRFGIEWAETGLGNYDSRQPRMQDLDDIIQLAHQLDLKVLLTMDAAYQIEHMWNDNPYRSVAASKTAFFTNEESKRYYKRKLRYVMSRWGYSTAIFAFELWNEVDFYDGSEYYPNSLAIRAWHEEMIAYMKSLDPAEHMYTTSTAYPTAGDFGKRNTRLMSSPAIDFAQLHHYESNMNVEYYRSYLLQRQIRLHDKPVLIGEYGNSLNCYHRTQNYTGEATHKVNEMHNTLWSVAMSGTGATGLYWWSDSVFNPCWGGQYQYFKPLQTFMAATNMLGYETEPLANSCLCGGPKDISVSKKYRDNTDCVPLNTTGERKPNEADILTGIRTSNDCKLAVFAVKTEVGLYGWVHNKDSYWYNLPHNADPYPGSKTDCELLDDNQPSSREDIDVITRQIMLIEDITEAGPYTVEFYSTYPTYDIDLDGSPDDGGLIPSMTITDLYAANGRLIVQLPKLQALGEAPYAPDYGFVIRYTGSIDQP